LLRDKEKTENSVDELQKNNDKHQTENHTQTFTYKSEDNEKTHSDTKEDKPNKKQSLIKDYEFESQAQDILIAQESIVFKFKIKCLLVVFITVVLFLLDFAPILNLIQPEFVSITNNPLNFIIINSALLIIAGVIYFDTAFKGIFGIFTFKSNTSSLVSLAFYGVLIYNLSLILDPSLVRHGNFYVISVAASFLLCFSLFGKIFIALRSRNNFKLLMDNKSFKTAYKISDKEQISKLMKGLGYTDASICYPKKVIFLTNYLEKSSAESSFDKISRYFAPLIFVIALLSSLLCYYVKRDPYQALLTFALICCIGAPITGEIGASLPMWRSCRNLVKKNAFIAGYETVTDFNDLNSIIIDAKSIFPKGTVQLKTIKAFTKQNIDEAIINAASLVNAAGGTLSDIFLSTISGRTELLSSVDSFEYEDELGLCGWVNNKRILLGNRELMKRHNIEIPSRDYESKVISNGSNFVYLAVGGELCALLVIEYSCKKEITCSLKKLKNLNVILLVTTNDSNITASFMTEKFKLNKKAIKILHSNDLATTNQETDNNISPCSMAFINGATSYASAVTACIKLHGSFAVASIFGIIGALLGVAFIIYTSIFVGIILISPIQLIAYQCIWAIPVLLISIFRKH
jgi:cation transport ATPase